MTFRRGFLFFTLLAALGTHSAQATVIYDEGVSGDLSDDNLAPTMLMLGDGSNIITGSTTASPLDRDLFTFTLGAGQELVAIILQTYDADDDQSFFAVAEGGTLSSFGSLAALLGNALIGAAPGAMEGDDVLDNLGAGTFPGSTGFTGSLGPGEYTFWLQETTNGIPEYALDFQVRTGVPLPSTLLLLVPALALLRRKRQAV